MTERQPDEDGSIPSKVPRCRPSIAEPCEDVTRLSDLRFGRAKKQRSLEMQSERRLRKIVRAESIRIRRVRCRRLVRPGFAKFRG